MQGHYAELMQFCLIIAYYKTETQKATHKPSHYEKRTAEGFKHHSWKTHIQKFLFQITQSKGHNTQ